MLTIISPKQRGSAAIETLLLVVVLIIPMWWLLFNMGYAGIRSQKTQVSSRITAYEVLARTTKGEDVSNKKNEIAGIASDAMFPNEPDVVTLALYDKPGSTDPAQGNPGLSSLLGGVISSMSGNREIEVSVKRTSPNQLFPDSDVEVPLVISGTPFTYCESKHRDFDILGSQNVSLGVLSALSFAGSILMAPFGGYPTNGDQCPN
ncbi:MAG: hypothetical protein AB8C02_11370 [Halioglobus sp.]